MVSSYVNQLAYLSDDDLEVILGKTTFFNPNWSSSQVTDALNFCYNKALFNEVQDGVYTTQYLGEAVTVALENRVFKTGYGTYSYTLQQFLNLLGGR